MPNAISIALLPLQVIMAVFGLLLLFAAVTLLALFFRALHRGNSTESENIAAWESTGDYSPVAFLSPGERSFFAVLELAVQGNYRVFAKVRSADVIKPNGNGSRSGWRRNFNRICGKHVDFVLCDRNTLEVVAVVELDDKTHARLDRGLRDAFVDEALKSAQIPVIRVPARSVYNPSELRDQCRNTVSQTKRSLAVVN